MIYDRTAAIAAVIAAVCSVLCLGGLAFLTYELQTRSPVRAERAPVRPQPPEGGGDRPWLSPLSIRIARAAAQPDGALRLIITLDYVNAGRVPAHGAAVAMRSGALETALSRSALNSVRSGDNPTCDQLAAPAGGAVIFPSSAVPRTYSQTDIMLNEKSVEDLTSVFVVQACIAYRVGKTVHHTKVCEFVEPLPDKPIEKGRLHFCADGNDAD